MPKAENDNDRRLLADIRKHGWHTLGISGKGDKPAYLFTVGLFHTFKHPELCIFGLSSIDAMGRILNDAGEMIRAGKHFQDGDTSDELLRDHNCLFRSVKTPYLDQHFGYARWYYEDKDFPMLQCIWPDPAGKYPWEPEFSEELVQFQPLLFQ